MKTLLRKVEVINETCPKHGEFLRFYAPVNRKWCQSCHLETVAQKKQGDLEMTRANIYEKKIMEVRAMIGDKVADFNIGEYKPHPLPRTRKTAEKLFTPDRKLWMKNIKLFFTGGGGTGKTFTASLACREAARVGLEVVFLSLDELRNLYKPGAEGLYKTLLRMNAADVLVIDDIEYASYSEKLFNNLKNLLDHRLERRKIALTILTSNLPLDPTRLVNFEPRRLLQFKDGMINFGSIPYPYTRLSDTGNRILTYMKGNSGKVMTYLDIERKVGISSPHQYRDELLGEGVRMVPVERGNKKLKGFVWDE